MLSQCVVEVESDCEIATREVGNRGEKPRDEAQAKEIKSAVVM